MALWQVRPKDDFRDPSSSSTASDGDSDGDGDDGEAGEANFFAIHFVSFGYFFVFVCFFPPIYFNLTFVESCAAVVLCSVGEVVGFYSWHHVLK